MRKIGFCDNFLNELIRIISDKEYFKKTCRLNKRINKMKREMINCYYWNSLKKKYEVKLEDKQYITKCKIDININKYPIKKIIITNKRGLEEILENQEELEITKIIMGRTLNEPIKDLPTTLKNLVLGISYNGSMDFLTKLTNLKTLSFGYFYNKTIDILSDLNSLKMIKFGETFNKTISEKNLPKYIKKIVFGGGFNQPLQDLPETLAEIEFGFCFDQTIERLAKLTNLRKLKFGKKFNQKIKRGSLPTSLKMINFGDYFNQTIEALENLCNLNTIKFGYKYDQPIVKHLSKSIKSLHLDNYYYSQTQELENLRKSSTLTSLIICGKENF